MRLIDADALIKKFEKFKEDSTRLTDMLFLDGAMAAVDNMPTITLEQQTVELLRKARKAMHKGISELKVHCKYFNQTPEEDACIEMHEAVVEIDKAIGGKDE